MEATKVTEMQQVTSVDDNDLLYIIKDGVSSSIAKSDFENSFDKEGIKSYPLISDLPSGTGLDDGVTARVYDEPLATDNGYYRVTSEVWGKIADPNNGEVAFGDTKAVSGNTIFESESLLKQKISESLIELSEVITGLGDTTSQLIADDGTYYGTNSTHKIQKYTVAEGEVYKIKGYIKNTAPVDVSLYAFYTSGSFGDLDSNGDTIITVNDDALINKEITIPSGVVHLKISVPNGSNIELTSLVGISTVLANQTAIATNAASIITNKKERMLQDGLFLIDSSNVVETSVTTSQLIADDGSYSGQNSTHKIKKLTVAEGEVYRIKGYFENSASSNISLYAFYSGSGFGTLVENGTEIFSPGEISVIDQEITIPSGVVHLKISVPNGSNIELTSTPVEQSYDLTDMRVLYKHFRSAEINIPYMFHGTVEWQEQNRTPRFNALNLTDWNESPNVWKEAVNWNVTDKGVNAGLSCILNTGDFIASTSIDQTEYQARVDVMFDAIDSENTLPILFCLGNHDLGEDFNQTTTTGVAKIPTKTQIKSWIFDRMYDRLTPTQQSNLTGLTGDTCYYYYDFSDEKTRVIALDDYEAPYVLDGSGLLTYSGTAIYSGQTVVGGRNTYHSQAQLNFLVSALASVPNDWNVVIMNHQGLNEFYAEDNSGIGNIGRSTEALREILAGFKTRTSGTANVNAVTGASAFSVNYDFTSRTDAHIVVVCGHYHEFKRQVEAGAGNIDVIQCISLYGVTSYLKFKDSVSEASADIISINPTNNELYVLRYGQTPFRNADFQDDGTGSDANGFHFVDTPIQL